MKRYYATFLFVTLTFALSAFSLYGCNNTAAQPSPSPVVTTPTDPNAPAPARTVTPEEQRYLKRYGRGGNGQKTP